MSVEVAGPIVAVTVQERVGIERSMGRLNRIGNELVIGTAGQGYRENP